MRLKMKSITTLCAVSVAINLAACSDAQNKKEKDLSEEQIKAEVMKNLGQGTKVDAVKKTPYGGLYEVSIQGDILYTDAQAKYLFVGSVLDAKGTVNYTQQRMEVLSKVDFSKLPLNKAIKYTKGNGGEGKRTFVVFEDPNCSYCKLFRKNIQELDNVTIYTFMYNILSPDSATISRNAWCSPTPLKAWDDWMLRGLMPPTAPTQCADPNQEVFELGRQYRVKGTPVIIFTDGSRFPGAVQVKDIEAKFAELEKNKK